MRHIIFRGKRVEDSKWVYGSLNTKDFQSNVIIITKDGINNDVDPKSVGQFTNLHDKNGKEIYEGDIIKDVINDSWSKVEYITGQFYPLFDYSLRLNREFEIIGNTSDNPDLWNER